MYSHWLNLTERLWKHLRRKVTHNHLFTRTSVLVKAIYTFLETLNASHQITLAVIRAPE